jgi:hypothetical protein
VEVSVDDGHTWFAAKLVGLDEPYAWRHWECLWAVHKQGNYTIMARATDNKGRQQPENASWNVLGYGNIGIRKHAIFISII